MKNNFINEKDIWVKSIKDIKIKNDLKESKINEKLEELKKQSKNNR